MSEFNEGAAASLHASIVVLSKHPLRNRRALRSLRNILSHFEAEYLSAVECKRCGSSGPADWCSWCNAPVQTDAPAQRLYPCCEHCRAEDGGCDWNDRHDSPCEVTATCAGAEQDPRLEADQ